MNDLAKDRILASLATTSKIKWTEKSQVADLMKKNNETRPVPEGLLKLIPRNTENLGVVGRNTEMLVKAYAAFVPGVSGQQFPLFEDFLAREFPKLDSLVVTRGSEKIDFPAIFGQVKKRLKAEGALLLEVPNPYCFDVLKDTDNWQAELPAKIQQWHSYIRNEAAKQGFQIDRQRWPGSENRQLDNWIAQQKRELPKFVMDSLKAPWLYFRFLPFKPIPLHFQAQVLKPVGGVNDVRIVEPLSALATLPGITAAVSRTIPGKPAIDVDRKIMILHRPILKFETSLEAIGILREQGYLIITEFDDHYSPWPEIEKNNFLSFAGVHAVQTTTPALASILKEFNPEIGIFPNQLAVMPDLDEKPTTQKVRVFFGALNREKDWAPLMPGLNALLRDLGGQIEFEVVFDRAFYDALETDQKRFTPQCPYDVYKSTLAGVDIALMPLRESLFNRMKSDLKFVEAAGFGAVPVASPVVYSECDPSGDFSVLCEQPEEFAAAIKDLTLNRDKLQKMQGRACQYVRKKRLLCGHLKRRLNWYQDLLSRRTELDEALEKRLNIITP